MHKLKRFIFSSIVIFTAFLFSACEYNPGYSTNDWVYSAMDKYYYYWIPSFGSLTYYSDTEDYFFSMLSYEEMKVSESGREYYYSSIIIPDFESEEISKSTYGIKYLRYNHPNRPGYEILRVISVLKDSPADKAGVHRGDFIYKAGSEYLNATNYSLLDEGAGVRLYRGKLYRSVGKLMFDEDEYDYCNLRYSRPMEEHPIQSYKIIQRESRRIAYLLYNSFLYDKTGDSEDYPYEKELTDLMISFKKERVNELILDLRYNGGGYLRTAKLLASLIVPQETLGRLMLSAVAKKDSLDTDIFFYDKNEVGDANLNLKRVFVIATPMTSGAGEAIINCLTPYMTVYHIGGKTEGEIYGRSRIIHRLHPGYELHPVSSILYNADGKADYQNGFVPYSKYAYDEQTDEDVLAPFGSSYDGYVRIALDIMGFRSDISSNEERVNQNQFQIKPVGMSEMSQKRGAILNNCKIHD